MNTINLLKFPEAEALFNVGEPNRNLKDITNFVSYELFDLFIQFDLPLRLMDDLCECLISTVESLVNEEKI